MKQQKVKLTKAVVNDAQAGAREYVIWDDRLQGFGLRVRPTGSKSFIYVYRSAGGRNGAVRRVTLKAKNPDVAYQLAKDRSTEEDPAAVLTRQKDELARARRTPKVADVLDSFIKDHAKLKLAAKTWGEYERVVEKILTPDLGELKIDALQPKHVAEMYHARRAKPTQAALAVRILSSAMSWAEENGLRPQGSNPARIRLKGSRRRTRLFSDAEVSRLLAMIATHEKEGKLTAGVALGLRLLFATGCRAGEICGLKWSNVDLEEGVMRWPNSKTGYLEKPITTDAKPLLKKAKRIVGVDWVLPSSKNTALRVETLEAGFERVMKAANVEARENASLHLIRHWFATATYTDTTIALPVQMAMVGHSSVATAMRYAHVTREDVMKAAQGAAKRRAGAIKAAGKGGKVVKLHA